ncbi:cysteine hydrolase (plasmid) [Rhizobium lusitanum]|uniref:cysteine hydrolase family protein n=1 Tax=Rhizobium lusitanum TaxID=293958 RepID=UPI00161B83EE|nr:isochorismatase family cysteine hydrolase [Rhizobium lusitanum]QND44263.1 cysteine hydrolase [Rhizobium lusitanum]
MKIHVYGKPQTIGPELDDYFRPDRSVVISIDMHLSHLGDSDDCPSPAPRAAEIIEPINQFHAHARALNIPIIHVRTVLRRKGVDDVNGISASWRRTWPFYAGENPHSANHAVEGSKWVEFVTNVDPDDLIINTKKRLSIFYPTDLDFLLRNLRKEIVVLNGGFTDCCVLNAAFDASNHNYRVLVAKDLVKGTNDELEGAALTMISLNLGLVVDSSDLLEKWHGEGVDSSANLEKSGL